MSSISVQLPVCDKFDNVSSIFIKLGVSNIVIDAIVVLKMLFCFIFTIKHLIIYVFLFLSSIGVKSWAAGKIVQSSRSQNYTLAKCHW